jgi:hypothetical protein
LIPSRATSTTNAYHFEDLAMSELVEESRPLVR